MAVTGGAGLIGSHLVERLLEEGCTVTCVDDLSTGAARNIAHLRGRDGFTFIEHDITRPLELDVEEIYNLACPASPVHYQRDPIRTTLTCVNGAYNLLALAQRKGATILQASTSEIYGDPDVHPQREGYNGNVNPIGPRACYDEGKRAAESLFFDFHRQHGVDIRIARIFNTYGPRMRRSDGRVISNFIVEALRGRPIVVYGNGAQTRAFCYVRDMVDGLIRLMADRSGKAEPVNLGNPQEVTILELAQMVRDMTGGASPIVTSPLPPDDPRKRCPDISRARRRLGWAPRIGLAEGLRRTIDHFAQELADPQV